MRRRSERKKSSDASPAPPATRRTSRRSRRSPDIEKHNEDEVRIDNKNQLPENSVGSNVYERASSEERQIGHSDLSQTPSRKSSRSSRKRTPLSDHSSATPTKKRSQRDARSPTIEQQKVDTILEEVENGDTSIENLNEDGPIGDDHDGGDADIDNANMSINKEDDNLKESHLEKDHHGDDSVGPEPKLSRQPSPPLHADDDEDDKPDDTNKMGMESNIATSAEEFPQHREVTVVPLPSFSSKAIKGEELKTTDVLDIRTEDVEKDCADADDEMKGEEEHIQKNHSLKSRSDSSDSEREQVKEVSETSRTNSKRQTNGGSDIESKSPPNNKDVDEQKENIEHISAEALESLVPVQNQVAAETKECETVCETTPVNTNNEEKKNTSEAASCQRSARKRKWITKKVTERNVPILAISTDSLKNIIADVTPVPLSDVQLETSSEEEGVISDRDDEDHSTTPERLVTVENRSEKPDRILVKRKESFSELSERMEKSVAHEKSIGIASIGANAPIATAANMSASAAAIKAASIGARSPSPARNRASSVLYITNLVRPFTVLQLKGLLARTGKIVENGFWIDRIKSKCYVEYETEDEAIETRHALHGVRWPVSNPKCLNVDFGSKANMERMIQSTKDEAPKFAQDNNRDNQNIGNIWSRSEIDDKKNVRPVREWDVGKKASVDREKSGKSEKTRRSSKDREGSRSREIERIERDRERKQRARSREHRSRSTSLDRKIVKKENEPPVRLLDDLFRKTKVTPCIYWLSLTPEQIAEKEAFRQKRIEEHKQRVKNRELEREKERERDRERQKEREREREGRERERNKRHRSNDRDRRRTRSRERRRY